MRTTQFICALPFYKLYHHLRFRFTLFVYSTIDHNQIRSGELSLQSVQLVWTFNLFTALIPASGSPAASLPYNQTLSPVSCSVFLFHNGILLLPFHVFFGRQHWHSPYCFQPVILCYRFGIATVALASLRLFASA